MTTMLFFLTVSSCVCEHNCALTPCCDSATPHLGHKLGLDTPLYSVNKTTWKKKKPQQRLWLTVNLVRHGKHRRNLCTSWSQQTPADYQFKTKHRHPPIGEPIQSRHLCTVTVCCVKASGRAILWAITAGQSSAAGWVSIGPGSTVHYHMGVATSSLLENCFQVRSKERL